MPRKKLRFSIAAAATVAVAAGVIVAGNAMASNADPGLVDTTHGPVRGKVSQHSRSFQGIPYAAAPEGDRRWQPPQPAADWDEPRDATKPGSPCPQLEGDQSGIPSTNEDCLYLNVTAPSDASKKDLPVMVFTHGGGLYGAGEQYEASRMAARGEAIVVTVNYRLGAFGFLGQSDVNDGETPNLGLADQQAALGWARDNAEAFGGDANNLTLMGESSGANTACTNLTSPAAAGLFDKLILESAPCSNVKGQSREDAEKQSAKVAKKLGCDGDKPAACMRKSSVSEVLDAYGPLASAEPIIDDELVPSSPSTALSKGDFHRVPVLHGINRDEERLMIGGEEALGGKPLQPKQYPGKLQETFGDQAAAVERKYPLSDYDSASEALAAAQTDHEYATGLVDTSKLLEKHVPTYSFEFADAKAPWFKAYKKPSFPTGAFHMAEMNYLFGMDVFEDKNAAQEKLGGAMIDYWTAFARDGEPTGDKLPEWQPYEGSHVQSLAPDDIGAVDFAADHKYRFWKSLE